MKKRLIEDILPLTELNKHAQKGGGIGSLNAMHPYFARRPLTASRAMTLAALIDTPTSDAERASIEELLVKLSSEEWPQMPDLLQRAQELIRQAHGGRAPRVLDPFAGGGSMPFEAMRLGCEATAVDLNPVAYLALMGTLVYPHMFNDVVDDQTSGESLPGIEGRTEQTFKLVEDVRYWAKWVMQQAQVQIGDCYPVDPDGATPMAYLWAKTIHCPHCGGEVPLIKRRWLQNGEGREPVAYRLNVDKANLTYSVEILKGQVAEKDTPDRGTMRGATVQCIYCGTPSERERIAEQGESEKISEQLLVVALNREAETGREFRAANKLDLRAYETAKKKLAQIEQEGFDFWGFERLLSVVPDEPTPPSRARSVSVRLYGIKTWSQMFNQRQLLAQITLGHQIRVVQSVLSDTGDEYAKAIALYLSLLLAKQLVYNSNAAWWQPGGLKIAPTMTRHDIQMTWDYAEVNPFSGVAASWESHINSLWRSIKNVTAQRDRLPANLKLGSATNLPESWTETFDAVITDPPYYDSITYADLSDYFYPWHKRVIGDDYPEAFVTEVTPKDEELVQEAIYHGGTKLKAKAFYEDGMANAFTEMSRVLKPDGIAVIMFAHKKTSAWETLVAALIRAGFQVTGSWPLNTEGRRLQSYRAVALASSVYLVCRKRQTESSSVGYLEDMKDDLRRTIRYYLERFWAAGIGGADFFMSAIGPGLSVYSRYARVERYDGTQVKVGDFLDMVRHEVAIFAIERILGNEDFHDRLDPATQFYLLWRWGYGIWEVPDGEALLLSTAVGIDLKVLQSQFKLVGDEKNKLRLLTPVERAEHLQRVTERVVAGGAVPLIDVLHRACLLWQADLQEELSALVAARGGELWPVAQAIVELLPRENEERKALMSMLGTRASLESQAQRWSERTQVYTPSVQQMSLWDEE
jgi:putative DNA methylase